MNTIFKELQSLYEEILSKEKIELHLKNLDRVLIEKEAALSKTQALVDKEAQDIAKLEGRNLPALFMFFLGDKERQLEKERQEHLQAFLQHQSAENAIKELKEEKNTLLKSYSSKFRVEEQFDNLLKKQQRKLKSAYPDIFDQLIFFEEKIANHQAKTKEIKQAIREGRKTIQVLEIVLSQLIKITDWGRKAKISRPAKDKLQSTVNRAETTLLKFEKELYDITDHYGLDYIQQIEDIKDFIGRFYDNLITDWIIKNRIENSKGFVQSSIDKISRIVAMLDTNGRDTLVYIEEEKEDKRAIILQVINKK